MSAAAGTEGAHLHRPPRDCPVCGGRLATTRLGCPGCGTELSGGFRSCAYCTLSDADSETLRVFLVSRGNMREVERHLRVSYPTARQRYADLLGKLGLQVADGAADEPVRPGPGRAGPPRADVLADLAGGRLDVEEAARLLGERLDRGLSEP